MLTELGIRFQRAKSTQEALAIYEEAQVKGETLPPSTKALHVALKAKRVEDVEALLLIGAQPPMFGKGIRRFYPHENVEPVGKHLPAPVWSDDRVRMYTLLAEHMPDYFEPCRSHRQNVHRCAGPRVPPLSVWNVYERVFEPDKFQLFVKNGLQFALFCDDTELCEWLLERYQGELLTDLLDLIANLHPTLWPRVLARQAVTNLTKLNILSKSVKYFGVENDFESLFDLLDVNVHDNIHNEHYQNTVFVGARRGKMCVMNMVRVLHTHHPDRTFYKVFLAAIYDSGGADEHVEFCRELMRIRGSKLDHSFIRLFRCATTSIVTFCLEMFEAEALPAVTAHLLYFAIRTTVSDGDIQRLLTHEDKHAVAERIVMWLKDKAKLYRAHDFGLPLALAIGEAHHENVGLLLELGADHSKISERSSPYVLPAWRHGRHPSQVQRRSLLSHTGDTLPTVLQKICADYIALEPLHQE